MGILPYGNLDVQGTGKRVEYFLLSVFYSMFSNFCFFTKFIINKLYNKQKLSKMHTAKMKVKFFTVYFIYDVKWLIYRQFMVELTLIQVC